MERVADSSSEQQDSFNLLRVCCHDKTPIESERRTTPSNRGGLGVYKRAGRGGSRKRRQIRDDEIRCKV